MDQSQPRPLILLLRPLWARQQLQLTAAEQQQLDPLEALLMHSASGGDTGGGRLTMTLTAMRAMAAMAATGRMKLTCGGLDDPGQEQGRGRRSRGRTRRRGTGQEATSPLQLHGCQGADKLINKGHVTNGMEKNKSRRKKYREKTRRNSP